MRRLPVLEPSTKGLLLALWSVLLGSIGVAFFLGAIPPASPALLQNLAIVGAILIPAYVAEVVWLVPRMGSGLDYEEWLGFLVGAAFAALLGVAIALLLGEHRAVGHSNWLDDLGLAWVAVSELVLAGALVLQPLLADRLREPDGDS
jgi:hypothetical protein